MEIIKKEKLESAIKNTEFENEKKVVNFEPIFYKLIIRAKLNVGVENDVNSKKIINELTLNQALENAKHATQELNVFGFKNFSYTIIPVFKKHKKEKWYVKI